MTDAEDKTAALLAKLWVKIRPLVEERLATLDQAAAAASAGTLAEDLRKEAAEQRAQAGRFAGHVWVRRGHAGGAGA